MKQILLGLAMGGLFAACTTTQSTGIAPMQCPPDSTLTYANFGSTFMTENCLECHGTKDAPTLKTQAQVASNSDRILQAAVYTDAMPKNSNMDVTSRELLGEWLACGAP